MRRNILTFFLLLFLTVFFTAYLFHFTQVGMQITTREIHHQKIYIENAVRAQDQNQGLSDRLSMPDNHAMLFVFSKEKPLFFWMHKMKFPLDIIWLDKNCRIVDISANQQPCEKNKTCPVISASAPAKYVLETVSGFAQKYQLHKDEILQVCD